MRIIYFFAAIILLSASNAAAQNDEFKIPDWLEFVEEIRIPNEQFSGSPRSLSIDHVGNVHFNAGSSPYLYSRRLEKLIKLDPEGCRPGADPTLPNSWLTPDGEIIAMFGTSFYWFNLSGKCLHYAVEKTVANRYFVALPGRNMAFIRDYTNPYTMVRMDASGNVTTSSDIEPLPIPNLAFRTGNGGLIFSNGYYYWVNSMTNNIGAYDAQFKLKWSKYIGLVGLPFYTKDITDQERIDMSYIQRFMIEGRSMAFIQALSAIDRNTLLLHARFDKEEYFQLFDPDGNALDLYKSAGYIRHNPNSRLFYRVENDEELVLYVYRLK